MKRELPVLFIVLITSFSCASRARVAQAPATPEFSSSTFKRHIANATYAGEGDLIAKALRQKLTADPDNLKVRLELAEHYRTAGFPELAVEHCRLAAARFPESGEVQLTMAKSLRQMGMTQEAADTLQKFLDNRPQKDPIYYAWLGISRDWLGDWKRGEADHRAALALADRDYLHNNLGYNLLQQGKKEQAADEFRKALALDPNSAVARNNLGLALASNPKEALEHWQTVGGPAAAHNNMASVLMQNGQYTEAEKELQRALEYNRSNPTVLENLRLVSELQGKSVVLPGTHRSSRTKRALSGTWRAVSGAPPKGSKKKSEEVASAPSN